MTRRSPRAMASAVPFALPLLALILALPSFAQSERAYDPKALEVYEQGKKLYDAKDYGAALERFDEAARIEPGAARWQYNRGLALKKLGRNREAIDALLRARDLDPAYKREEIDKKLAELGAGPPPPAAAPVQRDRRGDTWLVVLLLGGVLLFVIAVVTGLRLIVRGLTRAAPPPDHLALLRRMRAASDWLAEMEFALATGEDEPALREQHEQATVLERRTWTQLEQVNVGDGPALRRIESQITQLDSMIRPLHAGLERRLSSIPAEAREAKTGCFFCGRLLASDALKRPVRLQQGGEEAVAVACPGCESKMKAGQLPQVLAFKGARPEVSHWSEGDRGPVAMRHGDQAHSFFGNLRQVAPPSSHGKLAAAAAGGAVVALGAAALVNLDTLQEVAQQTAATVAAARSALRSRGTMDRDHS